MPPRRMSSTTSEIRHKYIYILLWLIVIVLGAFSASYAALFAYVASGGYVDSTSGTYRLLIALLSDPQIANFLDLFLPVMAALPALATTLMTRSTFHLLVSVIILGLGCSILANILAGMEPNAGVLQIVMEREDAVILVRGAFSSVAHALAAILFILTGIEATRRRSVEVAGRARLTDPKIARTVEE